MLVVDSSVKNGDYFARSMVPKSPQSLVIYARGPDLGTLGGLVQIGYNDTLLLDKDDSI